jgi:hypothetical protein
MRIEHIERESEKKMIRSGTELGNLPLNLIEFIDEWLESVINLFI